MISKKVIRYYTECGRGFWKKQKAVAHEQNCTCWKNPKFKTCASCVHKNIFTDSNGMGDEPHNLETWITNGCEHSESGVPAHKEHDYMRKDCPFHKLKTNL